MLLFRNMLRDFFTHTLASIIVLWLANQFLTGVSFTGSNTILIFCGTVLGFLNAFVKPVFKAITLPLLILTLGVFSFILNALMLEFVDIIFPELIIQGIIPLLITTFALSVITQMLQEKT